MIKKDLVKKWLRTNCPPSVSSVWGTKACRWRSPLPKRARVHVALPHWMRSRTSLTRHDQVNDLAAASDIVCLCVSTDEDVMKLVTGGLLEGLGPASVVVNHGTGSPRNAVFSAHVV